jgi:hypothetical protein
MQRKILSLSTLLVAVVVTALIATHTVSCQDSSFKNWDNFVSGKPQQQAQPQAQSSAKLTYSLWNDPAEDAFSVQLPQGWPVNGGTQRISPIEPHYNIRVTSSSGGTHMFFDDPNLPINEVPNQGTAIAGYGVGSWGNAPWGGKVFVSQYIPAPQYAQNYVRQYVCTTATNFVGGINQSLTNDLSQLYIPIAQAEGKQIHIDVAELSFKCGTQNGYVYAVTLEGTQPGAPTMWVIPRMAGYLSTPAETAQAAEAVHTMISSFQMNPTWVQAFARQCGDTQGNVQRESNALTQATIDYTNQVMAQEQSNFKSWQANQNANFNAIEHTNNAITGAGSSSSSSSGNGHNYNAQLDTKTVCDDLGRCATVDATVGTYYSDCSGHFTPGNPAGGPPPSDESPCWNKGH